MRKRFNTTGLCYPDEHYMVNMEKRLDDTKTLVDRGEYFIINRARQYGKTTTLAALAEYLKREYIVVFLDFQMIGSAMYSREDSFARAFAACFLDEFRSECGQETNALHCAVEALEKSLTDREEPFYLLQLFKGLTAVCRAAGRSCLWRMKWTVPQTIRFFWTFCPSFASIT